MNATIYNFDDYKEYLIQTLEVRSKVTKGERTRLAEHACCHTAHVSQVLNGYSHFTLEQAEGINQFLEHTKDQSLFFINLIQYSRAGTPALKALFKEQLELMREKQFVFTERFKVKDELSKNEQAIFYSSWHYCAIHVLVSVPGCHTQKGISRYLNISPKRVSDVLDYLLEVGLVVEDPIKGYQIGKTHLHLAHDAPMISKHHTNWRIKAIQSFDSPNKTSLNYSSVITCSKDDEKRIRSIFMKAVEEARAIVKDSKNEEAYCYSLDFFNLRQMSDEN